MRSSLPDEDVDKKETEVPSGNDRSASNVVVAVIVVVVDVNAVIIGVERDARSPTNIAHAL